MTTSSRFAVAVHTLTIIAVQDGAPTPSDLIAGSVNSHPTVVRRLLCMLSGAGIVTAKMGKGGGALLARPADEITLLEVYRAVEDERLFATHREAPNPCCAVGRNILPVLDRAMKAATAALERELAAVTIADVAAEVRARATRPENEETRPS